MLGVAITADNSLSTHSQETELILKLRFVWFQSPGPHHTPSDNGTVFGKTSFANYLFLLSLIKSHDVLDQAFKMFGFVYNLIDIVSQKNKGIGLSFT